MKRLYKIYKYITVLALSFGLFSCSNSITETIAQNSESKAQLCVSMDKSSARTILPESDVSADEITKVELLAKAGSTDSAASVKEWISDDSETAITKMTGDTEILIDAGTYDFTLNLYVSDVLCQVATLQNVTVHAGLNSLSFAAKYADGSFSISLTDLAAQGVTAVKAGLFTMESNGETAVTDFALESLTVTEDSVTYAKSNVPGGTYFIRFELYQGETKIDTLEDIIKIASARTTTNTLTLANINTLYTVTYNLNGGAWADGFTPVTSRNVNKAVVLPSAEKLTKDGCSFMGWYTDEDCTEGNEAMEIAIGIAENKTFYAKWGFNIIITPSEGDTITASPSPALAGETVTLTVEPADAHIIQGLPSITDANNQPITCTLESSSGANKNYTFTMPASAVTVAVTMEEGYIVTFHANNGEGTMAEQRLFLNQENNIAANEFTRTDFSFAGWATSANGGKAFDDVSVIPATQNYDLYAMWLKLYENPQNIGDAVVYNGTDTRFVPYADYDRTKYPAAGWEPYGIVAKVNGEDRFMVGLSSINNTTGVNAISWANNYHPTEDTSNPYYSGWRLPETPEECLQIRGSTGHGLPGVDKINATYRKIMGKSSTDYLIDTRMDGTSAIVASFKSSYWFKPSTYNPNGYPYLGVFRFNIYNTEYSIGMYGYYTSQNPNESTRQYKAFVIHTF